MAKLRKLVKTLEAAGWVEVTRRDGFAQWRHAGTGRRVTLPLGKAAFGGRWSVGLLRLAHEGSLIYGSLSRLVAPPR
jgi:predicted RNA binding protein YcfA (HicA-like mRNA interferase family)